MYPQEQPEIFGQYDAILSFSLKMRSCSFLDNSLSFLYSASVTKAIFPPVTGIIDRVWVCGVFFMERTSYRWRYADYCPVRRAKNPVFFIFRRFLRVIAYRVVYKTSRYPVQVRWIRQCLSCTQGDNLYSLSFKTRRRRSSPVFRLYVEESFMRIFGKLSNIGTAEFPISSDVSPHEKLCKQKKNTRSRDDRRLLDLCHWACILVLIRCGDGDTKTNGKIWLFLVLVFWDISLILVYTNHDKK